METPTSTYRRFSSATAVEGAAGNCSGVGGGDAEWFWAAEAVVEVEAESVPATAGVGTVLFAFFTRPLPLCVVGG